MRDNKGFSLVEVLVALAIIGVVVAASTLSINMITRANVEKGMRLVESTMGKLQTECTSKSKATYMYVYQDSSDSDFYIKVSKKLHTSVADIMSDSAEASRIETSGVDMYYTTATTENGVSAGPHDIKGNAFVAITYNKSDSSIIGYANGTNKVSTLMRIEAYGASKVALVEMAYETGKVTFESKNN